MGYQLMCDQLTGSLTVVSGLVVVAANAMADEGSGAKFISANPDIHLKNKGKCLCT